MKSCCEYHKTNCNQGRMCPAHAVRKHAMNNPFKKLKPALFIFGVLFAFGLVGEMDYQDELAAEQARKPTATARAE